MLYPKKQPVCSLLDRQGVGEITGLIIEGVPEGVCRGVGDGVSGKPITVKLPDRFH